MLNFEWLKSAEPSPSIAMPKFSIHNSTFKIALVLLPALWLVGRGLRSDLGANPIETVTHFTGDWTLRFLLLTLAVTPVRRVTGWNRLISWRRLLGLSAFFYGSLHFLTWIGVDHAFEWRALTEDVVKRPYVTAGFSAFLCMLPLAITSTRGWIRRLGKRWTQLHTLAYVAAVAGIVHYYWLVKADVRLPLLYGAILALLLTTRLWWRVRTA